MTPLPVGFLYCDTPKLILDLCQRLCLWFHLGKRTTYQKGVNKMNKNLAIKCKQDNLLAKVYQKAFDATYVVMHVSYKIAKKLDYKTLSKLCIALEKKSREIGDISIAAGQAGESLEYRGVLSDWYDIFSDAHCSIHFIILNKFGAEPCRA